MHADSGTECKMSMAVIDSVVARNMMAADFPDILPEPFSNPCASYEGSAEFINQVVQGCHRTRGSVYNGTEFSYGDRDNSESSHHSLILEDHTPTGRSSYSCEPNIIQLLVTEASGAVSTGCGPCDHMTHTDSKTNSMTRVQVRVECADEEAATTAVSKAEEVGEWGLSLLRPSPPASLVSNGSMDSLTPTPSSMELVSWSSDDRSSQETIPSVRGNQVAVLDSQVAIVDTILGERTKAEPDVTLVELVEQGLEADDSITRNLVCFGSPSFDFCVNRHVESHARHTEPSREAPPHVPKRRSHLSHLKSIQSPHILPLPTVETRKLSDPAIHVRRQRLKTKHEEKKQRCRSDSEAPPFPFPLDEESFEESCSSAVGGDSGYMEERSSRYQESGCTASSPRVSQYSDILSQEGSGDSVSVHQRIRRVTPFNLLSQESALSDEQPTASISSNPGTMVHPRERSRRSMLKNFSQSSIGGGSLASSDTSPSINSVLETQSNLTCATDILSSLGFDDFDSPQLVPDRFIPKELDYLRPSAMKAAFIEQILSPDPPRSPDSLASGQSSTPAPLAPQPSMELADLPLGATAENFLPAAIPPRPGSPIVSVLSETHEDQPHTQSNLPDVPLFTDTAPIMGFTRNRILETVPEETASDLSPSPRWLSPRVSIDHSVLDLAEGKLGASLVQKVRRRSLPTREGYRLSIGSLVESDTGGDSIQLSVTSYDDEIAAERERERESLLPSISDDAGLNAGRRRRRGVYTPPQTLLSWLSTQKTIDEEADADPDELPWPFNEQARLRKSLTEMSLAQQVSFQSQQSDASCGLPAEENYSQQSMEANSRVSVSPISTPNSRFSPQPPLSEPDEDLCLNDLEGEVTADSLEHGHRLGEANTCGFTDVDTAVHRDDVTRADSPSVGGGSSQEGTTQPGLLSIMHPQTPTTARQRKPVMSPLSLTKASPFVWTDIADCKTPLCLQDDHASFQASMDVVPDGSDIHTPKHYFEGGQVNGLGSVSNGSLSVDQSNSTASLPSKVSTTCDRSRRPQLLSLKQNSFEELLPADMSEIELLTGDIHTPVRKCEPVLRRQKSFEEQSPQSGKSSRPSRRRAVVGEAPSAATLFAATSVTENQNEVEKFMLL